MISEVAYENHARLIDTDRIELAGLSSRLADVITTWVVLVLPRPQIGSVTL